MDGFDGVLVVDKPAGPTSHDLVSRFRRVLKGTRVGHLGTLDPFATGVLPLCLGKATRLSRFLTEGEKIYEAEIRFGFATDTGDFTGQPLGEPSPNFPDTTLIQAKLDRFRGTFQQQPPRYSARKVQGVPLYKYARRGQDVERESRQVTIYELRLVEANGDMARLVVRCSAGTYIRSLAADLGAELGCGAHLTALRRTAAGEFSMNQAVDAQILEAEDVCSRLAASIIPLDRLLGRFPSLQLNVEGVRRVSHGSSIGEEQLAGPWAWDLLVQAAGNSGLVRLTEPSTGLVGIGLLDPAESGPNHVHPFIVLNN